ncbi:MAG: hypothetical protein IPG04_25340 [Polyangiaceae bacterium]|nr:hypothetical protein [Polyangiaceae bacterium]
MSFFRPRSIVPAAAVALLALSGCGKSPEAVCKKLDEISKSKDKQPVDECIKEMEEIKKEAPKGYDCIAECTDRTSEEALAICMLACMASDKELEKVFEKQNEKNRDKREAKDAEKLVELTKAADKTFDTSMKSFSDAVTNFSITIVEGYKAPKDASIMASFDHEDIMLGAPHFTIMMGSGDTPAAALDASIKSAEMLKAKVVKKESSDSGFVLHTESDFGFSVELGVKSGDKLFECKGLLNGAAMKKKDEFIPWIEKVCKSIKAK